MFFNCIALPLPSKIYPGCATGMDIHAPRVQALRTHVLENKCPRLLAMYFSRPSEIWRAAAARICVHRRSYLRQCAYIIYEPLYEYWLRLPMASRGPESNWRGTGVTNCNSWTLWPCPRAQRFRRFYMYMIYTCTNGEDRNLAGHLYPIVY